jgi:molybdenum cofactor synthesis domain-containing protein
LVQCAQENGWTIAQTKVVGDETDQIASMVAGWADSGAVDVILCTGGTGVALRDVTPDAIRLVAAREIPGFGEVMRAEGRKSAKFAALSRSGAFTRGSALILALPGSPRGAVESLNAVMDLIPHAINLLHGKTSHEKKLGTESQHQMKG